jgi:hemerythrin
MLGYLEGWLLKHILVTDRKYVETFREHGIQ